MSSVRLPMYRFHKHSGQAVVTLDARDFYLGPYNSAVSRAEYDRLTGEWLANGRRLPGSGGPPPGLTVNELLVAYWRYAQSYYVKGGGPRVNSSTSAWPFTTSGGSMGQRRPPSSVLLP